MRQADGAAQSLQGEDNDDVQPNVHGDQKNLLPVGKGLVKEGCDGGVAQASDSDRATGVWEGDTVRSVITQTLWDDEIAAGGETSPITRARSRRVVYRHIVI